MPERDLVFFSYRHDQDGERWLTALHGMLEPYVLGQHLIAWSDRDIRTGEQWHSRIQNAIDRSRVAILLVNQRFFASEYIRCHELPRLVNDARAGKLILICVLIGFADPALRAEYGLAEFQFGHNPSTPLSALRGAQRERTLVELAIKVRDSYGVSATAHESVVMQMHHSDAVRTEPLRAELFPDPLGALLDVPHLDTARTVARQAELDVIRDQLLHSTALAHGLSSAAPGLGLHGMGGMGKSVMAQALCHDKVLRRAFPDGIAWIVLGQEPDLLALQNRLLRMLAPQSAPVDSLANGTRQLESVLEGRRVLIVIDDIWDPRHFHAFNAARGRSRLLLTTRDASVLSQIGAQPHAVQRLSGPLAREILAQRSGCQVDALPAEVAEVVDHTGGLPLALALSGAQVAGGVSWATLVQQLRSGRIDFLDHVYGSVYDSLGRSVDSLPSQDRDRYLDLAVFPEDAVLPVSVVARLWQHGGGLSAADSEKLLAQLDGKALLTLSGSGQVRTVALHDLQHDFLILRADDIRALHGRLLDAYRSTLALLEGAAGWAGLPADEPYLWRQLAAHLAASGRERELESVLCDPAWIAARLASETRPRGEGSIADVGALRLDYAFATEDSAAQLVGRALLASAHVLGRHPELLNQQLFGRLGGYEDPELIAVASVSYTTITRSELWAPTYPALTRLGAQETALSGHKGSVNGALLLPGGSRALSWSCDLRLWNLDHDGEVRVLGSHEAHVNGALLFPDGHRALSWSDDMTLRLWDLELGGEARRFAYAGWPINGALLLADGRRALSWSRDPALRLWDLEHDGAVPTSSLPAWHRSLEVTPAAARGEAHDLLFGHTGAVLGAILISGGRRALSWSHDNTLRIWDLEDGDAAHALVGHDDAVKGALVLPDGQRALSWSNDKTLRLWDLEQGGEARVLVGHEASVNGALLLPGGRRALSWSDDKTLRLWDIEHGGEARVLAGHDDRIDGALVLPDGRRALSWSRDNTLRLWDIEYGGEARTLAGHNDRIRGALVLPDGRRALSWSADKTLRLWDLELGGEARVLAGHDDWISGAMVLTEGRRALSWSKTLRLWDLEKDGEARVFTGHDDWVWGVLVIPEGRRALSWSNDTTLRLWDLERGGEARVFAGHKDSVNGALLLPDARRALSWSGDTLRFWDLEQGGARLLAGHESSIEGSLLLPGGLSALSWSSDRTLRLWNLESGGKARILSGHEGWIEGVLLLPDGRRALSWSADHTLRLWDTIDQGEPRSQPRRLGRRVVATTGRVGASRVFAGHEGMINGVLLLPDGGHALSWSNDMTLRLWDLENDGDALVLSGHENSVSGALLLRDGRRALSWSYDNTLRLWDLEHGGNIATYMADATIAAVVASSDGRCVFCADVLGNVQTLVLNDEAWLPQPV